MRLSSLLLCTATLAGCTVGPDYHRPELSLTPAFISGAIMTPAADAHWWTSFGDALLDRVVERALAQNLDIAAAAARVDQARGAAQAAGAALLPSADATGSAEETSTSRRTPFGAASEQLGFSRDYALYQAGAQASWEIDLFGGLRRGREAARAEFAGSQAEADAIRLSIAAETVDAYLQLRGLQARLAVAERQLANEQSLVDLIRQRVEQGISADRELNRTLGERSGIEASLAPLRAGIAGQLNRLDVLMGAQAGTWAVELKTQGVIPLAPDPIGSAVPADLMRRRPDIVAAERRLAAANARIGVAIADYYPRLSLSGLLGVASVGTAGLFTGSAVQASGTAGLRWRLFDFGRVDAEVVQAKGRTAEMLALYRGSVLRATAEVETALSRLAEQRNAVGAFEAQVAALTASRDQVRQAYQGGVIALVDVLDADHALLEASDQLENARAEAGRASVAAIRALGGGWQSGA